MTVISFRFCFCALPVHKPCLAVSKIFDGPLLKIFDGPLLLLFGALRHGGDGIDVATRKDAHIALVVGYKGWLAVVAV